MAIKTRYAHIEFRSRLEATWAKFFDLCGWPYEYEPIDLDGYIPDFILTFPYAPLLVEVKPTFQSKVHEDIACLSQEVMIVVEKIENSGWEKDFLIVGISSMALYGGDTDFPCIGVLGKRFAEKRYVLQHEREMAYWLAGARLTHCEGCRQLSIIHAWELVCRKNGCCEENSCLGERLPTGEGVVSVARRHWAQAKNEMQYKRH
jgi:hypothetical protein